MYYPFIMYGYSRAEQIESLRAALQYLVPVPNDSNSYDIGMQIPLKPTPRTARIRV